MIGNYNQLFVFQMRTMESSPPLNSLSSKTSKLITPTLSCGAASSSTSSCSICRCTAAQSKTVNIVCLDKWMHRELPRLLGPLEHRFRHHLRPFLRHLTRRDPDLVAFAPAVGPLRHRPRHRVCSFPCPFHHHHHHRRPLVLALAPPRSLPTQLPG